MEFSNADEIINHQLLQAVHRVSAVVAFIAGAVADGNGPADITGRDRLLFQFNKLPMLVQSAGWAMLMDPSFANSRRHTDEGKQVRDSLQKPHLAALKEHYIAKQRKKTSFFQFFRNKGQLPI